MNALALQKEKITRFFGGAIGASLHDENFDFEIIYLGLFFRDRGLKIDNKHSITSATPRKCPLKKKPSDREFGYILKQNLPL